MARQRRRKSATPATNTLSGSAATPSNNLPNAVNSLDKSVKQQLHRRKMLARIADREHHFDSTRQQEFELQQEYNKARLSSIVDETEDSYTTQLRDLEEERDFELMKLYLLREFRLGQCKSWLDAEISQVDEQHSATTKTVHDKLLRGLESHVKRFKDDKLLWDVSSDASAKGDLGNALGMPGITSTSSTYQSRAQTTRNTKRGHTDTGNTNNNNTNNSNGYGSNGSGSESGFRYAARALRRTAANNNPNYNDDSPGNGTTMGNDDDDGGINSFLSEMESERNDNTSSRSRAGQGRHMKSAIKALTLLKPDEISSDLQQLRK